jgi:hypothetical protein
MHRFALILSLSILSLAFAATAAATPPTIEKTHEEFSFDIDCGAFSLHEDVVVDVTAITFYDQAGNPDRLQFHVDWVGVITNPDGETFRDPGHFTDSVDLAGTPEDLSDDTVASVGLIFAITVPGVGIVAQDTGLIIFKPDGSVVIHGPHEAFVEGNALLCSALG